MAFVQSLTVPEIVLVPEQTCSKYLLNKWTVYPFTSASLKSSHAFQHYFFWVLATHCSLFPCLWGCLSGQGFHPVWLWVDLYTLLPRLWACLLKAPQATVTLILENPTWQSYLYYSLPLAYLKIHSLLAILSQSSSTKHEATADLETQDSEQTDWPAPLRLNKVSRVCYQSWKGPDIQGSLLYQWPFYKKLRYKWHYSVRLQ